MEVINGFWSYFCISDYVGDNFMRYFLGFIFALWILFIVPLFIVYSKIEDVQNQYAELKAENFYLKQEIKEVEARCERMTDCCIDIVTNQRW